MEEQNSIIVKVVDFSVSPGPRYAQQGKSSGEDFYHSILNPQFYKAFISNKKIIVNLDGGDGYMSSFLDEAFGNLVYDFGKEEVAARLSFISTEEPEWVSLIENSTFSKWEKRRNKSNRPLVTTKHPEWYRTVNGKIEPTYYDPTV